MLTLAVETSCDETGAAVVYDGRAVLSNVVWSQIGHHAPFGGVVPEIASRQHIRAVSLVVEEALRGASVERSSLDAIAATVGPGLAGSLLVGANFSRGFALGLSVPFIPVNHLEGHLHSVWLSRQDPLPAAPELPLLALVASGGHTELVWMRDHGSYQLLGRTLDDAAGEAFDKVARLLGLEYPGGPAIQRAAELATAPVELPRAWLPGTYSFSFSGLKTAVLHVLQHMSGNEPARGLKLPRAELAQDLSPDQIANIAAGFQQSVVDVLVTKVAAASDALNPASVAVVGGVAANRALREAMESRIRKPLLISAPEFSTDNAAMIAAASYFVPVHPDLDDISPSLELAPSQ